MRLLRHGGRGHPEHHPVEGDDLFAEDRLTLRLRRLVEASPIGDEDIQKLRIDFPMVQRSFRGLEKALRDQVVELFAEVERIVNAERCKYVVKIEFPGSNPYFGLFVTNVNRDMVDRFDIDIFETSYLGGAKDVVRVHADKIEVVTDTARAVEKLSSRYLALQAVEH